MGERGLDVDKGVGVLMTSSEESGVVSPVCTGLAVGDGLASDVAGTVLFSEAVLPLSEDKPMLPPAVRVSTELASSKECPSFRDSMGERARSRAIKISEAAGSEDVRRGWLDGTCADDPFGSEPGWVVCWRVPTAESEGS